MATGSLTRRRFLEISAGSLVGSLVLPGCQAPGRPAGSGPGSPARAPASVLEPSPGEVPAGGPSPGGTPPGETPPSESPPSESPSPRPRAGDRLLLGLDTCSLDHALTAGDPANRRDIWWALDRLAGLGLGGIQIDPSHFPGDDEGTVSRLESAAQAGGLWIELGMGGWDVPRLAERIRLTARLGGRSVRVFCGDAGAGPADIAAYMDLVPPALRHAAGIADTHGVDIAVENHGDFTSGELVEFLERVGHPRVGACLDTGNSLFRREDPLECAKRLAPHVRCVRLKDWTVRHDGNGAMTWEAAVPGTGDVPVREILGILASRNVDLHVALEAPVRASRSEAETVAREWRHLEASAKAAREIIRAL